MTAALHSAPKAQELDISIFGSIAKHFSIDESTCYRTGMDMFVNMLETGIPPLDYKNLISSVEMLNTIVGQL
jgi:hypothetical protein